MKKMAAGTFKADCLAVIDEARTKRETVVITKHGKPIAKLVPVSAKTDDIYGFLAEKDAIAKPVGGTFSRAKIRKRRRDASATSTCFKTGYNVLNG